MVGAVPGLEIVEAPVTQNLITRGSRACRPAEEGSSPRQ